MPLRNNSMPWTVAKTKWGKFDIIMSQNIADKKH